MSQDKKQLQVKKQPMHMLSTSERIKKGLAYGNQRLIDGHSILYERNNESYEYIILSAPGWFELNGYTTSTLEECWHGNPCGLMNKDKIGNKITCVITRGLGTGLFNGKGYPKGYCIDSKLHTAEKESNHIEDEYVDIYSSYQIPKPPKK